MPEMDGLTSGMHVYKTEAKFSFSQPSRDWARQRPSKQNRVDADERFIRQRLMDLKEKRGDEFIETIHVLLGLAEPKTDDV